MLSKISGFIGRTFKFPPRRIPPQGAALPYSPTFDASEDAVAADLDFEVVSTLLQAADSGDAESMLELAETMEARDLQLQQVAETRRSSLTALEWSIDPLDVARTRGDQILARDAADYLRAELSALPSFTDLLGNMSRAIGPNLSVTEVQWQGIVPTAFERVKASRLTIDRQISSEIRIKTDRDPDGALPPPYKYIMHVPKPLGSAIFTSTLSRACAKLWVMKCLAQRNWTIFSEIFGMPLRIAKHEPNASASDKQATWNALRDMGARAFALLPKEIELDLMEVQRGSEPYSTTIEYIDRSIAKGWLGANLTTDTTGSGGLGGAGAAAIHADVKRLLTEGDMVTEERTLRATIFPWMLRYAFPMQWPDVPVPRFLRQFRDASPLDVKAEGIRKASQEIGLPVPRAWAMRELGIPEAADGEDIIARIEPAVPPGGGF